jgi:hypothetical protein
MASSDGQVASVSGFNYSAALKAMGGTWTFDALNKWLLDPRADAPGTAMTFAGLVERKAARRRHRLSQYALEDSAAAADRAKRQRSREIACGRWLTRPPCRRNRCFRRPCAHVDVKCISSRAAPARWRRNPKAHNQRHWSPSSRPAIYWSFRVNRRTLLISALCALGAGRLPFPAWDRRSRRAQGQGLAARHIAVRRPKIPDRLQALRLRQRRRAEGRRSARRSQSAPSTISIMSSPGSKAVSRPGSI